MDWQRQYLTHARTRAYARHVDTARRILDHAVERGSLVVSMSWGKDSVAMGDIAIEHLGRVPMLHLASPYALPGSEHVRAHFEARADVTVLDARRTLAEYIEWCREIGLPHERSRSVKSRVVSSIKSDRAREWCAERGYAVQALGMRIAEKGPRAQLLRAKGPVYSLVDGGAKACPLAYWSVADVWARIVARDLPYPRLYDCETHGQTRETLRNTGWLSTDGAEGGRLVWLRRNFPEQYAMILTEFPHLWQIADG